jgi:hypothetical protein
MLEQAVFSLARVGFLAGIQHQADIDNLFLLKFSGKKLVRMAGRPAPIQPAERITRQRQSHLHFVKFFERGLAGPAACVAKTADPTGTLRNAAMMPSWPDWI